MADRPMRADRSIRPEQRARFDARVYAAQQEAKTSIATSSARCELCGDSPARDFIPDRTRGWDHPRRLCASCLNTVLEQRMAESAVNSTGQENIGNRS